MLAVTAENGAARPASPPQTIASIESTGQMAKAEPVSDPDHPVMNPKKLKLNWKLGQASNAPFGNASHTYATPIVSEGKVYAGYVSGMKRAGLVFCFNADTGEKIWETKVEGTEQIKISLDRRGEFLYCTTSAYSQGYVLCLNKSTGNVIWKTEKEGKIRHISTPILSDRSLCIEISQVDGRRGIYGFDKADGKAIWELEAGANSGDDTTVLNGDRLYVNSNKGNNGIVQSLDINTGRSIWTYQTENALLSAGCVSYKGKILITTQAVFGNQRKIELHGLDGGTGTLIWKSEIGGEFVAFLPVVSGDRLFIAIRMSLPQGAVFCLDTNSGKLLWKFALDDGAVPKSSPAPSESHVYVVAQSGDYGAPAMKGYMYGLNASTGELIWRFVTKGKGTISSPPIVSGPYLYCAAEIERKRIGFIYCFATTTGERIRRLRTGRTIVTDPMINRGTVFAGTVDGYIYAFSEGNVLIGRIGLMFALGGLFLQFVFGMFQGTIHKKLDRAGRSPASERRQRYQKRIDHVERAFDKVDRLARSLSGGSGLLIINVYLGWLIMFLFILMPLSAVSYLFIIIPLDPWLPKWWPFAAYGFNAAIIAAFIYLV